MEPFPPELIAQIATKLFQQGPQDSSAVSNMSDAREAIETTPVYGKLPEIPAAFPNRSMLAEHAPVDRAPINHVPAHMEPMHAAPSLPNAPQFQNAPQFHQSPSAPSFAPVAETQSRSPLSFRDLKSDTRTPSKGFSHPPQETGSTSNDDGLARFVAQVRNQTPAQRNDYLDRDLLHSPNHPPGYQHVGSQHVGSPHVGSRSPYSGSHTPGFHAPGSQSPSYFAGHGSQIRHSSTALDVNRIRDDFPILRQKIHGHPLAWLDNAATTQKPQVVIDAISHFYETDNSNIHRAAHSLAARATDAYEAARETTARFLGAGSSKDIVFVRGTTEAINLVSNTYGARYLKKGDEILLSTVEHHANIVPWQMIAKRKGAVIRVIPINDRGEIIMDEYLRLLSPRTRIVALTHASNSLGSILPVAEMTHMAKRFGARVLIDGAQSVSHMPINVQAIGCDFFVFSGHKIFGPTGVGALYVTEELHDVLPPWQGGGNMIKNVTFEKTTYSDAPAKFEAGTPNIADAVGLKAALDYVAGIGLHNIAAHEHALLVDATEQLSKVPGLRIIGNAREKVSVVSFVLDGHPTEEVGKALDQVGIAVRSGHHCAQPSLRRFGVETTVRPSFSIYNTHNEVSRMVAAVRALAKT